MTDSPETAIRAICQAHGNDPTRMMDIVSDVQRTFRCVSPEAMTVIAETTGAKRVEVEGVVSFYAFFSEEPKGEIVIRLCNDVIDRMKGFDRVAAAFSEELGIPVGGTTEDGMFTLETTPCIGMCDQAPAALINDVVVTELSTDQAREIVQELREHRNPEKLVKTLGDGENANDLVQAMVKNNLRNRGDVVFSREEPTEGLRKALAMSPTEVIRAVKTARVRGRGGAGFPTGMKWEFTRMADGDRKFVVCNADEGEPGTFKDRVILTQRANRVFAGMTIAGYAIGSTEGIVYLRAEYRYLKAFLEDVLEKRRTARLLGKDILDNDGFDFDIRIQMGGGAYVCGEETSLLSSAEGLRGDPRNRPPFPAQSGYLGCPTTVNNVETFCSVVKILENGPATYAALGSTQSSGTKILSISGDCKRPGVYEIPFGDTLSHVLQMVGAEDAIAVQMGGPSGQMVGPDMYERTICYDDLATGGSVMVFGPGRDVIEVAHAFMEFFEEESCGYCTPCRAGNVLLKEALERILGGRGEPADLVQMEELCATMKATSRCGLGQTSSNPVASTLANFRGEYEKRIQEDPDRFQRSFDLRSAVKKAETIIGRESVHAGE